MVNNYCIKVRKKEEIRIVKGVVSCETGKAQLLESSGLYSNYYMISSALNIGKKICHAQKQAINKYMSVKINRFIIIPPFFV